MGSKNKVKKSSFTELYLVSKKDYNTIKSKKSQIKNETTEGIKNNFYPGYLQTLQTLPYTMYGNNVNNSHVVYANNEKPYGNDEDQDTFESRENVINEVDINNQRREEEDMKMGLKQKIQMMKNEEEEYLNSLRAQRIRLQAEKEESKAKETTMRSDNQNSIIQGMDVSQNQSDNHESIIQGMDITRDQDNPPAHNEYHNLNIEGEHPITIQNYNARVENIDLLNQKKRSNYLNRKKANQSDIDVINSRIRSDVKNKREKYREDILNSNRYNITNTVNRNAIELPPNIEYPTPHQELPQITVNNPNTLQPVNNTIALLPSNSSLPSNIEYTLPPQISVNTPNALPYVNNPIALPPNNNSFSLYQPLSQTRLNNRNNPPEITSSILDRITLSNPRGDVHGVVNTQPSIHLENTNLNSNNNRKRTNSVIANPSSTVQVKRGVNTSLQINPSSNIEVNHPPQNGFSQNVDKFFEKYNNENDQRRKIHKKAKVIIIEKPEVKKSLNSELVDRILQSNTSDPYDVLQISKTAKLTYSGLKRKFNALSKKLHPDKEASPGAHEAFIIMRRAFIELKKEIQISEEINKGKSRNTQNPSSAQRGYGIKKWMKLFK